jgi:regulatory protein YycI of two-component signal transduction system YycFG
MKKVFLVGFLLTTIVLFAAFTFVNSAESSITKINNSQQYSYDSIQPNISATATAGAMQFHIQLTAIAEQGK